MSSSFLEDEDSDDEIPPSMLFADRKVEIRTFTDEDQHEDDPQSSTLVSNKSSMTALLCLPSTTPANSANEQSLKAQGEKDAEVDLCSLLSTFHAHKISSLEQVFWFIDESKKRKKRGKEMVYPCFLDPGSNFLPVFRKNPPKSTQAIVQYFGKTKFRYQNQIVLKSKLRKFEEYFDECFDLYLQTLRAEQQVDSATDFEIERTVFRRILDHFRTLKRLNSLAMKTVTKPEVEQDDYTTSDASSDDEDNEVDIQPQLKPTRVFHCNRYRHPVRKLRAGDYIRYCPEHLVFCHNNMLESLVVEVYATTNMDDIAVSLASGHFLTKNSRIQVLKRFLNKKHKDVSSCGGFVTLGDCKLDTSLNGKVPIDTLSDKLTRVFNDTTAELKAIMNHETTSAAEGVPAHTRTKRRRVLLKDRVTFSDRPIAAAQRSTTCETK